MVADYGYLSLSVQAEDVQVVMTRAEDDAPLIVELWKGETKQQELTSEDLQDKIALEAGDDYKIVAYTASYNSYTDWTNADKGEAVYYKEETFGVKAGETTSVDVEVPMINYGVRLVLPEGFENSFPTYTFTVTVGERTLNLRNGEAAYFPYSDSAAFSYVLEATNVDGEQHTDNGGSNLEIASGTIYSVTYVIATQSFAIE